MGYKFGFIKRNADVFGGARAAGVDRVDIHLKIVDNITGHHGALQKMQIVQHVGDTRCVMNVLQSAVAILSAVCLDQMHGGTGRALMHPGA